MQVPSKRGYAVPRIRCAINKKTRIWNHHYCRNLTSHMLIAVCSMRLNGSLSLCQVTFALLQLNLVSLCPTCQSDGLWAWEFQVFASAISSVECIQSRNLIFWPSEQSGNYLCHMLTVFDTVRPTYMLHTVPKINWSYLPKHNTLNFVMEIIFSVS
jgi:hypothetical protein